MFVYDIAIIAHYPASLLGEQNSLRRGRRKKNSKGWMGREESWKLLLEIRRPKTACL